MLLNWIDSFPRDENEKYLRNHHLDNNFPNSEVHSFWFDNCFTPDRWTKTIADWQTLKIEVAKSYNIHDFKPKRSNEFVKNNFAIDSSRASTEIL